jgi:hypothetical protein
VGLGERFKLSKRIRAKPGCQTISGAAIWAAIVSSAPACENTILKGKNIDFSCSLFDCCDDVNGDACFFLLISY